MKVNGCNLKEGVRSPMKNMLTIFVACLFLLLPLSAAVGEAPPLPADLTQRQLKAGEDGDDGQSWLLYSRNHKGWRYSPLDQIDKHNVRDLGPAWVLPTGMHDAFEASPIVVDGVMYFSTPWNHVYAVDAATGGLFWHYAYPLEQNLPLCCGAVNRGVGVGSGKVVFTSLDAHLVALDAKTGKPTWRTKMADIKEGYSATVAPQVVGNKVIVGISGADFGVRGFVDAYDIDTGKRLWRFWSTPGPGEPGHETWAGDSWKTGGGSNWMTTTYDKDTNTVFAGICNPCPDLAGFKRQGDNLYTDSIVALDGDTGKLKWHYQTIPHDVWDLDVVAQPVIDDITLDGRKRQVIMIAPKNGYFYVLDRTNGQFIYAIPFAHQINWGKVGPDGKVHKDESLYPSQDKWVEVYPGAAGGKEWCPVAYNPETKRFFIPCIENGMRHKVIAQEFHPGLVYWNGASVPLTDKAYGHVAAIDVEKKKIAWDVKTKYPVVAGIACTASGLVITGTPDQKMLILDAENGKELWSFMAMSGWHSAPVVYGVNGKEYIAFANGWGGWVAGFDLMGTPGLEGIPVDNALYVFSLPDQGPRPQAQKE